MEKNTQSAAGDPVAENAALKKRIAELEANQTQAGADEGLIKKKMAAGLTRDQAIRSIANQRRFDEQKKKTDAEKAEAAKKKAVSK
jgi:uncharacterized protein YoaH (UPF0181 family)